MNGFRIDSSFSVEQFTNDYPLPINPNVQFPDIQFSFGIIVQTITHYPLLQSVFQFISKFQNNFLYLSLPKVYIKSSIND